VGKMEKRWPGRGGVVCLGFDLGGRVGIGPRSCTLAKGFLAAPTTHSGRRRPSDQT